MRKRDFKSYYNQQHSFKFILEIYYPISQGGLRKEAGTTVCGLRLCKLLERQWCLHVTLDMTLKPLYVTTQ